MKLLIDIGNTRLKCATWDGVSLRKLEAVANEDVDAKTLAELWSGMPPAQSAWVASVASDGINQVVEDAIFSALKTKPVFVHSVAGACGVRNAYAQPRRLGVDRFLGLIAAHHRQSGPVVIAGCGTALTLDALADDGWHLGGLIAPSPELMRTSLYANTARLMPEANAGVVEMADDTNSAIESGTRLAAVSLVERFMRVTSERLARTPTLILTGGGAVNLGEYLAPPHRIEDRLVLHGLALLADSGDWDPAASAMLK